MDRGTRIASNVLISSLSGILLLIKEIVTSDHCWWRGAEERWGRRTEERWGHSNLLLETLAKGWCTSTVRLLLLWSKSTISTNEESFATRNHLKNLPVEVFLVQLCQGFHVPDSQP